MTCKEADKLIPLFLDDDLDNRELAEFLNHVETCAGCKETIPYGKPFAYYGQSAYCSKKCCVDHIWDGDNDRLLEASPDKSLEEYDREFLRYYSYE